MFAGHLKFMIQDPLLFFLFLSSFCVSTLSFLCLSVCCIISHYSLNIILLNKIASGQILNSKRKNCLDISRKKILKRKQNMAISKHSNQQCFIFSPSSFSFKLFLWGGLEDWGDGTVVNCTYCSCRRTEISFQYPCGTGVTGCEPPRPLLDSQGNSMHTQRITQQA